MSFSWPQGELARVIDLAECKGQVVVTCESSSHAKSFRHALYNFRRRTAKGLGARFFLDTKSCTVTIFRANSPKLLMQ
jgi:hypothetical protein